MINSRAYSANIIHQVIHEKRSLNTLFNPVTIEEKQKALIQELIYGTLRWYYQIKPIAERLLQSPLKPKNRDVLCLLLTGLYQLIHMNIPEYAVVSETVEATKALKKPWAKALINKTLRRFLREKNEMLNVINHSLSSRYAHPSWLIQNIKKSWPHHWQAILNANNQQAPLFLRINQQKITRNDYLKLLKEKNIDAIPIQELPYAIQLKKSAPIHQLPGFNEGYIYVQDISGQFAAMLLDVKPHQYVLDACAAPGSKTTHILEIAPKVKKLVAIDKDPTRLKKIPENVDRLGLPHHVLKLILADATNTKQWWTGEKFDRILLDAPCSGTGIIRRHPDIKILRKESDLSQLTKKQQNLLQSLWPLLAEGGKLLYSTCTVLPEENEMIIKNFLSQQTNAAVIPLTIKSGLALSVGYQLLPNNNNHDGFYYSLLNKIKP